MFEGRKQLGCFGVVCMSSLGGSLSVVFLNISYVPSGLCCGKGKRFDCGLFCLYIFDISRFV